MLVCELVDEIDPSLAIELYAVGESAQYERLGLFRLDMPASREELLEQYGDRKVKRQDEYKAYVLMYLE